MTVAEYIADFLVKKNVKHIFGFQGSAVAKIIDACVLTDKIKYVQNYHEQASAFCADAYSRITGNIGVAIATSGPGATNLITGIANAQLDSIPALFITGQDYSHNFKKNEYVRLNGFQDLDIVSIVKPITKYAKTIFDAKQIRYELEKAFYIAKSGRPGAVLLDIPLDIQFAKIDIEELESFNDIENIEYEIDKTNDVINAIKKSKRPVVLAGGGIHLANAFDVFKQFINKTNIPVVNTLNGIDAFEGSYSFAGLHGNTFSNLAILNADLIIAVGARFGQRQVGKDPKAYSNAKIIHIDIDKNELNRIFDEELSIYSELKIFLEKINLEIISKELPNFNDWHDKIKEWEKLYNANTQVNKTGIDPVKLIKDISPDFTDNAIITADIGQNQMWVSQAIRIKGRQRILNSSGLGSMGYSLPAAIGAKFANNDAQVLAIMGDGGLHMNIQELLLIGHKRINIKTIVMNNNTLGMIREVHKRYYDDNYYGTDNNDFVCADLKKLADTFKLEYLEITKQNQVSELKKALDDDKPYIIDVKLSIDSVLSNRYDEAPIFKQNTLND